MKYLNIKYYFFFILKKKEPNPDEPAETQQEIAVEFKNSKEKFNKKAKEWTEKFAVIDEDYE